VSDSSRLISEGRCRRKLARLELRALSRVAGELHGRLLRRGGVIRHFVFVTFSLLEWIL
jgi:hypothetical protein